MESTKLTQEQIDFYHREGYLSLPAITTDEPRRAYIQVYALPTQKRDAYQTHPWQAMQQTARAKRAQESMASQESMGTMS